MNDFAHSDSSARNAILARVRNGLRKNDDRTSARAAAQAYVAAHRHGPRSSMPSDLATRFVDVAQQLSSTVERIGTEADIPPAVARYLTRIATSTASAVSKGVCWPAFAELDWRAAGMTTDARPATGDDRVGITGCFCAIAETGTLVLLSGADTPTATALLPETHVAVVRRDRIVSGMEEAFALIRTERPAMPRALNLISGPSRTGDIEQTIVLGAHGPFRVHVLLLD